MDGWTDGCTNRRIPGHKEKCHKNTGNGAEVKGGQDRLTDLDP